MKGFAKKITGIFLIFTLMTSLTACGGNTTDNASKTEGSNDASVVEDTSKNNEKQLDSEEEVTLTLWSIATESDAFNPAYTKAIADYEAAHPGVKIVHETFENESYKTKIKNSSCCQ